jgi:hypothetical protein
VADTSTLPIRFPCGSWQPLIGERIPASPAHLSGVLRIKKPHDKEEWGYAVDLNQNWPVMKQGRFFTIRRARSFAGL